MYVCICVCVGSCFSRHEEVRIHPLGFCFSFRNVGPEDCTQVFRLGAYSHRILLFLVLFFFANTLPPEASITFCCFCLFVYFLVILQWGPHYIADLEFLCRRCGPKDQRHPCASTSEVQELKAQATISSIFPYFWLSWDMNVFILSLTEYFTNRNEMSYPLINAIKQLSWNTPVSVL